MLDQEGVLHSRPGVWIERWCQMVDPAFPALFASATGDGLRNNRPIAERINRHTLDQAAVVIGTPFALVVTCRGTDWWRRSRV
jgi:hypothetical protein